tara:strand:+ start:19723 stop:20424 length:702 start_codon:yes stop_codon:yes gene_type:complete
MHELTELANKYGSDKGSVHVFTEKIYGPLFQSKKEKPINILEIGAGKVGGSHKMWKEYFINGEVYCMDPFFLPDQVVTIKELEDLGINIIRGNQLNREDLLAAGQAAKGGYDIIIDDGAHMPDAIQLSVGLLFPYLKSGGYFIIEDLATARRRGGNIDDVNENLLKLDTKNLMKERHVPDYTLEQSLAHYQSEEWLSNVLQHEEKQYLVDNIRDWKVFDDGGRLQNICVIVKK